MDGPEQGYLEARLHKAQYSSRFVSVAVIDVSTRKRSLVRYEISHWETTSF